ncbi:MAG: hypothetical protein MUC60_11285 [Oscillatoria sp. Prado101]|nr:hypothetical protein [Oscillatoria sp. Prado101]
MNKACLLRTGTWKCQEFNRGRIRRRLSGVGYHCLFTATLNQKQATPGEKEGGKSAASFVQPASGRLKKW